MPALIPVLPQMAAASAAIAFGASKMWPNEVTTDQLPVAFGVAFGAVFVLRIAFLLLIYFPFLDPLRGASAYRAPLNMFEVMMTAFARPPRTFLHRMKTTKHKGLIYYPGLVTTDRIVLTGPKALADVLVARCYDFEKPPQARSILRRILGIGLIVAEGDVHRTHRKKILPTFSFRAIRNLYPMMMRKSWELTEVIYEEMEPQLKKGKPYATIEMGKWCNRVTLDIIGIAGLGREFGAIRNQSDHLVKNYEWILEPTFEKLSFFAASLLVPHWFLHSLPWSINSRLTQVTDDLGNTTIQFVQQRRDDVRKNPDANIDVISTMIKMGEFTDKQLADHLLTFLAAGHETTSATLSWLLYLTSQRVDVQDKMRAELMPYKKALKRSDLESCDILEKLPWLNGACMDTTRLYPVVPYTMRTAINDTEVSGFKIRKGTEVIVPPWTINRDPALWGPDAEDFRPERWMDPGEKGMDDATPNNTGGSTSNYSMLTFLHGPRSCIGQGFAKAELRCLVAAMTMQFRWELEPDQRPIFPAGTLTLKPKHGISFRFYPVED